MTSNPFCRHPLTTGSSGRDIRKHPRLHKAAGGRGSQMRDKIHLDEARRLIVPIVKGPHRYCAPDRRAEPGSALTPTARNEPNL